MERVGALLFFTLLLALQGVVSAQNRGSKVSKTSFLQKDLFNCDEDCRRNKRRRKIKETKSYLSSVRDGELTESERKRRLIMDRLLAGELMSTGGDF